jgi:Zn-dependent protease with chaperone function
VTGLVIALLIALVMSIGSYRYGDRVVLASARAKEVSAKEQPRLHNIVEGLSIAAGIPRPRVYIVPEQAPSAFATGRDPEHSSIAVTQGLLETMNRVELEGVIGHELAHVRIGHPVGHRRRDARRAAVLLSEFFTRRGSGAGSEDGGATTGAAGRSPS